MSNYIYDLPDWPRFRWNQDAISPRLAAVRHKQDRLIGRMQALGFPLRKEAELRTLTLEVLKSSEIEGEILDKEQVRSSVARRLGVDIGALTPEDRKVEGVVEMVLDATRNYDKPLTRERLFAWHASLFPTAHSGTTKILARHRRPCGSRHPDERPGRRTKHKLLFAPARIGGGRSQRNPASSK